MTFVSFSFYIFLSVVVLAYYLLPQKVRWVTLLIGSLYFYFYISAYSPFKLSILVFSAFLCWLFANLQRKDSKRKNGWFFLALLANAFPLLLIKEAPFFFFQKQYHGSGMAHCSYRLFLLLYAVDCLYGGYIP